MLQLFKSCQKGGTEIVQACNSCDFALELGSALGVELFDYIVDLFFFWWGWGICKSLAGEEPKVAYIALIVNCYSECHLAVSYFFFFLFFLWLFLQNNFRYIYIYIYIYIYTYITYIHTYYIYGEKFRPTLSSTIKCQRCPLLWNLYKAFRG